MSETESDPEAVDFHTRSRADEWLARMSTDQRLLWLRLRPDAKRKVKARLEAVLSVKDENDAVPLESAVALSGDGATMPPLSSRRLRQLVAAWDNKKGLAALGVRAAERPTRPSNIDDRMVPIREAALVEMRRLLAEETPPRTEEALRRVVEVVGTELSRKSLLRWWTAERRRVANGRVLGRDLAFDICRIGATPPSGRSYLAVFVVDAGARLVLAGSLLEDGHLYLAYRRAAADARKVLARLPLAHFTGAVELERLTIAQPAGTNSPDSLNVVMKMDEAAALPIESKMGAAVGRRVIGVAGQRLGMLRLLSYVSGCGAESGDPGSDRSEAMPQLPELDISEAKLLLDSGINDHIAEVAALVSQTPPAEGGGAAAKRLIHVLDIVAQALS